MVTRTSQASPNPQQDINKPGQVSTAHPVINRSSLKSRNLFPDNHAVRDPSLHHLILKIQINFMILAIVVIGDYARAVNTPN